MPHAVSGMRAADRVSGDAAVAADIDASCLQRSVRCRFGPRDADARADLEFALVARQVGANVGALGNNDFLLAAFVFHSEDMAVYAGHGGVDGAIGHRRAGTIPGPKAFARPSLRRRENRHLDGFLTAVRLRHGADANELADFDVGEAGRYYAEH